MDTKWRKSKIVLSFTVFFVGMTLLLTNFFSMLGMLSASGLDGDFGNFRDGRNADYQELEDFRWFVSGRLETLLAAATGGEGMENYGIAYSYDDYGDVYYGSGYGGEWWEWQELMDTEASFGTAEAVAEDDIQVEQDQSNEASYEGGYGIIRDGEKRSWENYMAQLSNDRNIRYAVAYQGKLLYTNIDGLASEVGKELGKPDFSKYLPEGEYNFSLLFNGNGDGKVEITKDGELLDIYGNGVYTPDSRWYVPGYTNFNVDEAGKEAVVFMAVAKDPKLYVVGNYSKDGTTSTYGGRLYYMKKSLLEFGENFRTCAALISAGLLLLVLAFLWRKEKRLADQTLVRILGKIPQELKALIFLVFPVSFLCMAGRPMISELMWRLQDLWYSGESVYFEEIGYLADRFLLNGTALAVVFWLIYFGVLDLRGNKGRQKRLFTPLVRSLRTRDLSLAVQKRMVRRYRLLLISYLIFAVALGIQIFNMAYFQSWSLQSVLFAAVPVSAVLCAAVNIWYMRKNRRIAEDIGALSDQIADVRNGNLTGKLELAGDTDLKAAADNLGEIQQGMDTALAERTRSERMKVELVANVSHDIKTPLTSIISYVELLKQEKELPEHVREYIRILGEKSERLKTMVQDVFDVSKAASDQLPVNPERLDLGKLLRQTMADMDEPITKSGLVMKVSIPEEPVYIRADGQRLYRVFQNLIQNALVYSLSGSRIFLTLASDKERAITSIKNISGVELDGTKDFTERFVRGDASRTDGGSGLGLSIAKSFTEACGGTFRVETDADLFTVTVAFLQLAPKTE